MSEIEHSSTCDRADDLVSVLYGEAGERERRDFEVHMQHCAGCRAEFAAFAQVRESIGEWRDEALTGFVPASSAPVRKSALAALRQFFDLSPLWFKGAVGFAAVVFCVLAALAIWRLRPTDKPLAVAETNPAAVYTQQDLDRAVQDALAKHQREQRVEVPRLANVSESPTPKTVNVAKAAPRARRPFSRAEREQLAAELRLLSSDDEADLDQFVDRINRQR
jgi:hypothetical protein